MSNEQMRIAIAESLGWKQVPDKYYEDRRAWVRSGERCATCDLLDYLNDLNACREFEKTIEVDGDESDNYALELLKLTAIHKGEGYHWGSNCDADYFRIATATAPQRCEAYLKTKGLWK